MTSAATWCFSFREHVSARLVCSFKLSMATLHGKAEEATHDSSQNSSTFHINTIPLYCRLDD